MSREIENSVRSKSKDFERRNEKCLVASWHRYIIDSFTFHRIFQLHFSSTRTPLNFFFTRLFTARSACIHLTGQPSQTGFPPAVKKPCPHFVHLLLLFPLSFLLFLRANLPTIFLHDRVLFYISRSIEELINREKSFVIVGE